MPFRLLSSSKFLVFSLFFLFSYYVSAFNITNILSRYPDFSTFNNALTQTGVAGSINSRQTITVLAVDNGGMSVVSGKPADIVKKVLSLHVVLDYYDVQKLQQLPKKTATLTTLLQASGQATGQLGFLNVTKSGNGQVSFGSAVPGSSLSSNLVKSIVSQPYNVSVLQISSVILPQGLGTPSNSSSAPAATPKNSPAPVLSPKKSPSSPSPATSNVPAPAEAATSPADDSSPVGSPSATPPAADSSPVVSPPMPAGANEPTADGTPADAPAGAKSGADADNRMNPDGALVLCLSIVWSLALLLW